MSTNFTEEQSQTLLAKLPPKRHGIFTNCTAEYHGTKSWEELEAFLVAASDFKQMNNISDAEALSEIPLLLKNDAAIWWQGVKEQVTTWENFKDRLQHAFVPIKPAYVLYQEILGVKQDSHTSTENFIAHKRMLFAQLPPPTIPEFQQLDMIYGQLKSLIQENVPRESITSYDELLEAAREVEQISIKQAIALGSGQEQTKAKKKCSFCRYKGHLIEECRRLKRKQNKHKPVLRPELEFSEATQSPSSSELKDHCNGCGAPGVARSSCPTCAGNLVTQSADLSYSAENIGLDVRNRPIVFVEIADIKASAFIDTCATPNLLAYQLYKQVAQKGYEFSEEVDYITLADGISKQHRILKTTLPVKLENRVIPTPFIVLPECKNTSTLLGVGFILDAKMILNLAQFTWQFVGDKTIFELYEED